jgi:hypothetical protein
MPLTAEERQWLEDRKQEVQRELDQMTSSRTTHGYHDKSERQAELLLELENLQEQLGEPVEDEPAT